MTDISIETVEQCRDRGGDALEGRDDRIGNTLVEDTVGYQEGFPLIGDSYSDYPDREDLANPQHGEFLETLFSHELVGSYADAVSELTAATSDSLLSDYLQAVESAAELHGLDTDSLFANAREPPTTEEAVSSILGYEVDGSMLDSTNTLLLSALYVEGLSVGEISELLERRETDVEDCLKSVGLLNGRTTDEQETAFREKRGEVNRPSGGVSVNHTAVEESDSISVVSR